MWIRRPVAEILKQFGDARPQVVFAFRQIEHLAIKCDTNGRVPGGAGGAENQFHRFLTMFLLKRDFAEHSAGRQLFDDPAKERCLNSNAKLRGLKADLHGGLVNGRDGWSRR